MARGRMINQSITKSKKFNLILESDFDRLVYCLLLPFADRDGRMEGDPDLVNSMIFPRRKDVSDNQIETALINLAAAELISYYSVSGDYFIEITQFREGQEGLRYTREKESNIPPPDDGEDPPDSGKTEADEGVTPANAGNVRKQSAEIEIEEEFTPYSPPKGESPAEKVPYAKIIDHLNKVCGTSFKSETASTRRKIRARWNESHRLEDFCTVIDGRFREWGKNPEMVEYLRPDTLFGNKMEAYLQAARRTNTRDGPGEREVLWIQCECGHQEPQYRIDSLCVGCGAKAWQQRRGKEYPKGLV